MREMKIKRNPRGYYTLYVDDQFYGNYDTYGEAAREYEQEFEKEESA